MPGLYAAIANLVVGAELERRGITDWSTSENV